MPLKASDKPEISKKWVNELPDDIDKKVRKDLETALGNAEKSIAAAEKKSDAESIEDAIATLNALADAADKTYAKCDKKKHKDVMAVLAKFENLCDDEIERLQKMMPEKDEGKEDEEEDEKGVFKPEYLARMIKQLRSGNELNFAFGLNKQTPEDSCLVLCNKRKPERLFKMMKRSGDFSNRLLTFGSALGDGKIIEFRLSEDAKEPSQIVKTAKGFLKGNKELKFRKIRVICGGKPYEEDMEEEGQAEPQNVAGGDGNLQQRLRSAAAAAQTWKQTQDTVDDQIASLRRELDAFDDQDVKSVRDRLDSVFNGYPKLDFAGLSAAADQATFDRNLAQTRAGVAQWRQQLGKDAALRTIDENPFGVNTRIVQTVNEALGKISNELNLA